MGHVLVTNLADFDVPLTDDGDRVAPGLGAQVALKRSDPAKAGELELSAPPDYQILSEVGPHWHVTAAGVLRNSFEEVKQYINEHRSDLNSCKIEITFVNFHSADRTLTGSFNCNLFADTFKNAKAQGNDRTPKYRNITSFMLHYSPKGGGSC